MPSPRIACSVASALQCIAGQRRAFCMLIGGNASNAALLGTLPYWGHYTLLQTRWNVSLRELEESESTIVHVCTLSLDWPVLALKDDRFLVPVARSRGVCDCYRTALQSFLAAEVNC